MGCLIAEPVVNRLEESLAGQLLVLQIDIFSTAGKELAARYGSRVTPTFIMLDGDGQELWRSVGNVDPERVRESVTP